MRWIIYFLFVMHVDKNQMNVLVVEGVDYANKILVFVKDVQSVGCMWKNVFAICVRIVIIILVYAQNVNLVI